MTDERTREAAAPVALVIGAGDYLGGAIARRFAQEGFHAVATRRRGDLSPLVEGIRAEGLLATGLHSDARDEAQVEALFEQVEREIGPVEVLVFNIGANVHFPVLETTAQVYRKVWEMCAFAGFLTAKAAATRMIARGRGGLYFTGATASVRGGAGFSAFAGGKHALRALAQSMARELGPKNIHVAHLIIDGAIDNDNTRALFPQAYENMPEDGALDPAAIAEAFWRVHAQPRSAWTFEADLRPYSEKW